MFRLVKLGSVIAVATVAVAVSVVSGMAAPSSSPLGIGEVATPKEISRWDIDIRPDGQGLPPGQGNVLQGEALYAKSCAQCHGDFGEGLGNYPVLVGGDKNDLENGERPEKTIGSFWPYATTLFDYIRRAMPFGDSQSLTADETYALTAFLLSMNEIIPEDSELDAKSLAAVKMPNEDGFYFDPEPDVANKACMSDCTAKPVEISSFARILNVTPDGLEPVEQAQAGGANN
ncbi:MAG: cytochrome c [Rhodospirillales bacterium]|nr:cytochrome c [Rhodospirillales bacterium]